MKTFYWKMTRKNGTVVEGRFAFVRRAFGRIFLGEKYEIIGKWYDS